MSTIKNKNIVLMTRIKVNSKIKCFDFITLGHLQQICIKNKGGNLYHAMHALHCIIPLLK